MGKYLLDQVGGNTSLSIFLGFWATLTNALFAYMGTELIGVTVGEVRRFFAVPSPWLMPIPQG